MYIYSYSYGFITFKHSSSAKEAIEEMNGAVVGGGKIKGIYIYIAMLFFT